MIGAGYVGLVSAACFSEFGWNVVCVDNDEARIAGLKSGIASPSWLIAVATIGNVGGSACNWWLGRHVRRFEGRRWFPFDAAAIDRAGGIYLADRLHRVRIEAKKLRYALEIQRELTHSRATARLTRLSR